MPLQFYDYRKENIVAPDGTVIGETKIRFPEMVVQAQKGALPTAILCVERVNQYKDQEEVSTRLPNVTVAVTPEFLGESLDLYDPLSGDLVGTMPYGQAIGVLFSIERGLFERAEAMMQAAPPVQE